MDILVGKSLEKGKYTLDELLGRGGFGITFKATHHFLDEVCVIKTLNPELRTDPQFPLMMEKFRDEAERLRRCEHPNIVRMRDFFVEDGVPYLVMDYIPGPSLEQVIFPDKPLPEPIAIRYIRQIGSALEVVHSKGLLHRDIKPENIILRQDTDQVILIDFGIARQYAPGVTQTHTNLVTVGYAPVEQYMLKAKRTPATDVYGLAATLYAMVTAQVPVASIMRDRQPMPEPRQINRQISRALNQAILRGMALEVEQRPATVSEWMALLPEPTNQPVIGRRGKSPSTAPTVAISPPSPKAPSATPTSSAGSPVAAPKRGASSTMATVAISPQRPAYSSNTVGPSTAMPVKTAPPQRSGGKGFVLMGLAILTGIAVSTVAAVLNYSQPTANAPTDSPSDTTFDAPPVVEDTPVVESSPSPIEELETSPEPEEELPIPPDDLAENEDLAEERPENSDTPVVEPPSAEPESPNPQAPSLPTGATIQSVPGFPPGTQEQEIVSRLGDPARVRVEEGSDVRIATYIVPEQVDLVYIYDKASNQVQQTEAYFAPYMDFNVMRTALNGMLEYRATQEMEQALEEVRRGRLRSYDISTEQYQGVIEQNGDRIYVGVWQR